MREDANLSCLMPRHHLHHQSFIPINIILMFKKEKEKKNNLESIYMKKNLKFNLETETLIIRSFRGW